MPNETKSCKNLLKIFHFCCYLCEPHCLHRWYYMTLGRRAKISKPGQFSNHNRTQTEHKKRSLATELGRVN